MTEVDELRAALAQAEAAHKAESRDKAVQKKKYEKKLEDFKAKAEEHMKTTMHDMEELNKELE